MLETFRSIFKYFIQKKKWWLIPIIIFFLLLGGLIIYAQGTTVAPFVYTFF